MTRLRVLPDVPFEGRRQLLERRRQEEAETARLQKGREKISLPPDHPYCTCCEEYVARFVPERECPITQDDLDPFTDTSFLRSIMATHACYLPMLDPEYVTEELFCLALCGKSKETQILQRFHSDPQTIRSRDCVGNTVLMLACCAREISQDVLDALLKDTELDVNVENDDGLTALHFAVLNNQPDVVQRLLAQGADVNAGRVKVGDKYLGLTPVLLSIIARPYTEDNRCLTALLHYNPDLSVQMVRQWNPFDTRDQFCFSWECDCGGCISVVAQGFGQTMVLKPSKIMSDNWAELGIAVQYAVSFKNTSALRTLLDKYQENRMLEDILNACIFCKDTLFALAIARHNINAMEEIFQRYESHVNSSLSRYVPKMFAVLENVLWSAHQHKGLKCLYPRCRKLYTPVKPEFKRMIDLLLKCSAFDVESKNKFGNTPLLLAARFGYDDICETLLNRGANVKTVHARGYTAITLALDLNTNVCLEVIRVLFKTGLARLIYDVPFEESDVLQMLVKKKDSRVFQAFRRAGAISEANRVKMLKEADKIISTVAKAEAEEMREFCQTLKATPLLLKRSVLLRVFGEVELVGRPDARLEDLKTQFSKLDKDHKDTWDVIIKPLCENLYS